MAGHIDYIFCISVYRVMYNVLQANFKVAICIAPNLTVQYS